MPEISRNAPILLTGLPSCLSATNTTSSSCLPKKLFTPALYLQSPTTPNVFGKQSTNSSTANPPHHYSPLLALHFQTALLFFTVKISKLCLSHRQPYCIISHSPSPPATPPDLSVFTPSEPDIHKILSNYPNMQSDSDPIPTCLIKECSSVFIPAVTNIVNLSLISGHFHPILKQSVISPQLKIPTLDKDKLCNYWPIPNLSHMQNNRMCRQIPSYRSLYF